MSTPAKKAGSLAARCAEALEVGKMIVVARAMRVLGNETIFIQPSNMLVFLLA
jgi:hypothetical protein